MLELIKYIVDQFAEDKENVSYEVTEKDRAIEVTCLPEKIGRRAAPRPDTRAICRHAE